MDTGPDMAPAAVAAVLEHLTGAARGTGTWLNAPEIDVVLSPANRVLIAEAGKGAGLGSVAARLRSIGETYEIEALEGRPLWVNGRRVDARSLKNGDVIEFGETGPLSRFRLFHEDSTMRKSLVEVLGDCAAYLRSSRQPVPRRMARAARSLLRQLVLETTILFRVSVILTFAVLAGVAYQQWQMSMRLQNSIDRSTARLDSIAATVARTSEEALRSGDLAALRTEIGQSVTSNTERLAALERRSHASRQVIADAAPSVAFLQGAYGFRERATGRVLRRAVSDQGVPLITPGGRPVLTLEGDGPVVEIPFTGSGFFIAGGRTVVTNRHVALPWESAAGTFDGGSLEPLMKKLIAYLPGRAEAIPLVLLIGSDEADLALLQPAGATGAIPGLRLADSAPVAGDEVIVLGYPTGLRAMLAQTGPAFIEELQRTGITGFWKIAERLARDGDIAALASRGIVAQITPQALVYDAETTYGGSGGPVLDMNGRVVAVNAAILPEYGGSNLGVPAVRVRELLDKAGLD
ncbi:MAG: trypsin-like peptidase domain-containing protein [Paracoccaceae bacterium]